MKHSKEYYERKFAEIKDYADLKGLENPYGSSLTKFISDYEAVKDEGSKNVMKDLKYYLQYETSYNTARAMLQKVREFGGPEKLRELKGMNTRAFAEKYLEQLKADQEEAKAMFGDGYSEMIGIWWFGSSAR